jgi:hypothetical protein
MEFGFTITPQRRLPDRPQPVVGNVGKLRPISGLFRFSHFYRAVSSVIFLSKEINILLGILTVWLCRDQRRNERGAFQPPSRVSILVQQGLVNESTQNRTHNRGHNEQPQLCKSWSLSKQGHAQ